MKKTLLLALIFNSLLFAGEENSPVYPYQFKNSLQVHPFAYIGFSSEPDRYEMVDIDFQHSFHDDFSLIANLGYRNFPLGFISSNTGYQIISQLEMGVRKHSHWVETSKHNLDGFLQLSMSNGYQDYYENIYGTEEDEYAFNRTESYNGYIGSVLATIGFQLQRNRFITSMSFGTGPYINNPVIKWRAKPAFTVGFNF